MCNKCWLCIDRGNINLHKKLQKIQEKEEGVSLKKLWSTLGIFSQITLASNKITTLLL